mgnify:CR=1 FL=1
MLPSTEIVRAIRRVGVNVNVLMMTENGDASAPLLIEAGCVGITPKTAPIDTLVAGIRDAVAGRMVLSQRHLADLLQRHAPAQAAKCDVGGTARLPAGACPSRVIRTILPMWLPRFCASSFSE